MTLLILWLYKEVMGEKKQMVPLAYMAKTQVFCSFIQQICPECQGHAVVG